MKTLVILMSLAMTQLVPLYQPAENRAKYRLVWKETFKDSTLNAAFLTMDEGNG